MFICTVVVLLFVLSLFVPASGSPGNGSHPLEDPIKFAQTFVSLLAAADPELFDGKAKREGKPHRERKRRYVNDIFNELGPHYVRRAYRMEPASFWKLGWA